MNYIINYGLQSAFEMYNEYKMKLIELAISLDMYTDTLKDVISMIDDKIDAIIENSSPELKSNYSNKISK